MSNYLPQQKKQNNDSENNQLLNNFLAEAQNYLPAIDL